MADPAPSTPNPLFGVNESSISELNKSLKYYMRIALGRYIRPKPKESSKVAYNTHILLPLPGEIRDDTSVNYTNVNLETVGDAINGAGGAAFNAAILRNAGELASMLFSGTKRGFEKVAGAEGASALRKIVGGTGSALSGMMQSIIPPEQFASAIQQMNGAAPNPNPSVAFQGPVLRDFTMSWVFYPKNKAESQNIDKMIRILKSRALPTYNFENASAVLNYPYVCQLNFFPWDTGGVEPWGWNPKTSIIKVKKCFMSNVNVNYNAYGTPAFLEGPEGYPATIQLTISFKEIEYLTGGDWDAEFAGIEEGKDGRGKVDGNAAFDSGFNIIGKVGGDILAGLVTNFADRLEELTGPDPGQTAANATRNESALANLKDGQTYKFDLNPIIIAEPTTGAVSQTNIEIITTFKDGQYIVTQKTTIPAQLPGLDDTVTTSEVLKTKDLQAVKTLFEEREYNADARFPPEEKPK